MYLEFLYLLFITTQVHLFNIDTQFPVIFRDESKDTAGRPSYFGYSVQLHKENEENAYWILVGAPRGNSTTADDVIEPGTFFKCSFEKKTCEEVVVDRTSNGGDFENNESEKQIRNHNWIGVSLDSERSQEGRVVVCGHRWMKSIASTLNGMNGVCYWMENNMDEDTVNKETPTSAKNDQLDGDATNRYSTAATGIDVHFSKHGDEMLLGSPGLFYYRGSVVSLYSDSGIPSFPLVSTIDTRDISNVREDDYFGYSITSGIFFNDKDVLFAAGSPRGNFGTGVVRLYKRGQDFIIMSLNGQQLGEYFGASVTAIDVNNDGFDDLLVGAPMFDKNMESSETEHGRVSVYQSNKKKGFEEPYTLSANSSNSRFGSCVVGIGDINGDGFNDVAIGAPYEDGSGSIYIYMGSRLRLNQDPAQVIKASSFDPSLTGFGISISRAMDIDANNFPDIVVGSYTSGHVVLLRAKPNATLTGTVLVDPKTLPVQSSSELMVKPCLLYQSKQKSKHTIQMQVRLELDTDNRPQRVVFKDSGSTTKTYSQTLQINKEQCKEFPAKVTLDDNASIDQEVNIFLDFSNIQAGDSSVAPFWVGKSKDSDDKFCANCPVLSPNQQLQTAASLPFQRDCGDDEICKPDLKTEIRLQGHESKTQSDIVIGKEEILVFTIEVKNIGKEPGYDNKATIFIPEPLSVDRVPRECSRVENGETDGFTYRCILKNPILKDKVSSVDVSVSTHSIKSDCGQLIIQVESSSSSSDTNPKNNKADFKLNCVASADITVNGISRQEQYKYDPLEDENKTIQFIHEYTIEKFGISPLDEVTITLQFPYSLVDGDNKMKIGSLEKSVINEASITKSAWCSDPETVKHSDKETDTVKSDNSTVLGCPSSSVDVECMELECKIGSFGQQYDYRKVMFHFTLYLRPLVTHVTSNKDYVFMSSMEIAITDPENVDNSEATRPDNADVQTRFLALAGDVSDSIKKVPTWAWFVTGICCLVVLAVIVLVLWKCNFFKRNTHPDALENKEDEVEEEEITEATSLNARPE